ncbi:hypothetical protein ACQCLI_18160 [Pseudomonas nitroreducens]|nr:hypothetical protein [Pseudomonas nitroreducens]
MNKLIIAIFLILGITSYIYSHRTDDVIVAWCRFIAGIVLIAIGAIGWMVSN